MDIRIAVAVDERTGNVVVREAAIITECEAADVQHPQRLVSLRPLDRLTPRERDVLALTAAGIDYKTAARQMGIAERTVRCHMVAILAKTDCPSGHMAGIWALAAGIFANAEQKNKAQP